MTEQERRKEMTDFMSRLPSVQEVKDKIAQHQQEGRLLKRLLKFAEEREEMIKGHSDD